MAIDKIARVILGMRRAFVTRVAIDGVDGAGKTVFGAELRRRLEASVAKVIREGALFRPDTLFIGRSWRRTIVARGDPPWRQHPLV